jgi:hypothetical protein
MHATELRKVSEFLDPATWAALAMEKQQSERN